MTGMLAQQYIPDSLILDWGPPPALPERALPKQWGANYWWSPIAGLECREFKVITTIDGDPATPESIHAYKTRVGKAHETYTRPGMVAAQFEHESIGYAPLEFPAPRNIRYRAHVVSIDPFRKQVSLRDGENIPYERVISTVPLPALRAMVDAAVLTPFDVLNFRSTPIYVVEKKEYVRARDYVWVDYRTAGSAYRATTHLDGSLHLEYAEPPRGALSKKLLPGRIYDVNHTRALVHELSLLNIHCFGRYARWDSDELLHQTDADLKRWATLVGLYV